MLSDPEGREADVSEGFEGTPFPRAQLRAQLEQSGPLRIRAEEPLAT